MTKTSQFTIDYQQCINPQGEAVAPLPSFIQDREFMVRLYRTMVLMRFFDDRAIKLQRTGKMGTYASTLGQEALSVGYGSAMAAEDVLAPYYRDYGAQYWRGVALSEISLLQCLSQAKLSMQ